MQIGVKTGPGLGMFRLNIDGVNQGQAQDEYTSAVGYTFRDLGTVTFFGGGNKGFQFLVSGKNVSSSEYVLGSGLHQAHSDQSAGNRIAEGAIDYSSTRGNFFRAVVWRLQRGNR